MDAMFRANGAANLSAADVVITVPLQGFLANDFARARDLIKAGYDGAEAARDQLLPLALGDEQWQRARESRRAATLTRLPRPAFVRIDGAGPSDTARMARRLAMFQDADVDIDAIELALGELGGLDRFETVTWRLDSTGGQDGLVITALPKSYGPPFLFLGGSLENTTSNEFRFGLSARYLAFDILGSGTELRIDGALGSEPAIRAAWYRPIGTTPFFIEPVAQAATTRISVIDDDRIVAEYGRRRLLAGLDAGFNPGRLNEVRIGARAGSTDATVRIGDPDYPDITGDDLLLLGSWTYDTQDDPLLPRRGLHLVSTLTHFLEAPVSAQPDDRSSADVTKLESSATWFRPLRSNRAGRMLAFGGIGTSFDGHPLVIDQFELGGPARLTAFGIGEARGDHYAYGGAGYLHRVFTLPDFLGRSVFAGGWLESGSAFDHAADAKVAVHGTVTLIADTLIGPIFAGASAGIDGKSRFYLGIGRIFR
jgi:NTE family protein